MRLSALELQGFKSFPDKTRLVFHDGITAVVGPNGSGKSNIGDAIRWVFGEQSTKMLRGERMEDVIFNGTQSRKPVGYAAVEITIENTEGTLPEYPASITIGRRLYRSGESEYRINGTLVRLKDVHELFLDTGLGRDGYSIIGQGRIAEIVAAKSTGRREIFEEAAGIAKFRYRRTEATRQLAHSEENLVRLRDILTELEQRVEPLRKQSEKAKQYLVLAEEQKALQFSLWEHSLHRLKEDMAQQNKLLRQAKEEYETIEQRNRDIETQLQVIFANMQQIAVEIEQTQQNSRKLQAKQAETQAQIAVLYNDIAHNQKQQQQIEAELAGSQGAAEAKLQQVEKEKLLQELQQQYEHKAAEQQTREAGLQALQQELQNARETLVHHEQELKNAEQALQLLELQQASSSARNEEYEKRLQAFVGEQAQQEQELLQARHNSTQAQRQVEEQVREIAALENMQAGYRIKLQDKEQSLQRLLEGSRQLRHRSEQTQSRMELLEGMEANLEGYSGSVKFVLGQAKKGALGGILGTVSTLLETDAAYITALEVALGAAMQHVVVEDERAAQAAIGHLKEAGAGRATFLPLTSVKGKAFDFSVCRSDSGFIGSALELVRYKPHFRGIMEQLLGRIAVVDTLQTGTRIAKAQGYRFRVVTLDGQVINAGGSFTGGSVAKSSGVLSRKQEILALRDTFAQQQEQLAEQEPLLAQASKEVEILRHELQGYNTEEQDMRRQLVKLELYFEQSQGQTQAVVEHIAARTAEREALLQELEDTKAGTQNIQQQIERYKDRISLCAEQIVAWQGQQTRLLAEQEQNTGLLANQQIHLLNMAHQMERVQAELEQIAGQIEQAAQRQEERQQKLQEFVSDTERIRHEIAKQEAEQARITQELQTLEQAVVAGTAERLRLEQSSTTLRQAERDNSSEKEQYSRELVRLEERLQVFQTEYDAIIATMWDEYELTRSELTALAQPVEEIAPAKARLAELKLRIRSLGSVNLEALDEYEQVAERYTFLSAQVADVEQSCKKLMALIEELTADMRKLFVENFEKISAEFSGVFIELFGGGTASLKLQEEADVLEAGIEIQVQPPGKMVKNLSLLSGGEQSFVAIAIYFAILKVKPTPFVLLDEIEAALDDINVMKYANYLRKLAGNVQFIAITHRRGTMEEADVLYGVTMQQEGVSKLLELDIAELEQKLGMGV